MTAGQLMTAYCVKLKGLQDKVLALCLPGRKKKGKCGKSILYGGPKSHLREKIYKNYKLFISSSFSFVLLPSNLTQMLIHFISNIFKIIKMTF